jgi:hypothetical protein
VILVGNDDTRLRLMGSILPSNQPLAPLSGEPITRELITRELATQPMRESGRKMWVQSLALALSIGPFIGVLVIGVLVIGVLFFGVAPALSAPQILAPPEVTGQPEAQQTPPGSEAPELGGEAERTVGCAVLSSPRFFLRNEIVLDISACRGAGLDLELELFLKSRASSETKSFRLFNSSIEEAVDFLSIDHRDAGGSEAFTEEQLSQILAMYTGGTMQTNVQIAELSLVVDGSYSQGQTIKFVVFTSRDLNLMVLVEKLAQAAN